MVETHRRDQPPDSASTSVGVDRRAPASLAALVEQAAGQVRDDPGAAAALLRGWRAQLDDDTGDGRLAARVAYLLAQAEAAQGHLDLSLDLIEEAGTRYLAAGDATAALRTNLGRTNVLRELGRFEDSLAAGEAIRATLAPDAAGADAALLAGAEQNIGLSLWHLGRFDDGIAAFSAALARYEALGDIPGATEVRGNRARVLVARGRVGEAADEFAAVADGFAALGMRAYEAMARGCLAEAQALGGDYAGSLRSIEHAGALLDHIDAPIGRYEQLMAAGQAYLALNLLAEAEDRYRDALALLESTELEVVRALAGWGLSQVLTAAGSFQSALEQLDATLAQLSREPGEAQWRARAQLERAVALHGLGRTAEAHQQAVLAFADAEAGGAAIEAVGALVLQAEWSDAAAAEPLLEAAHRRAEELNLAPLRAATGQLLGRALLARGELERARPLLEAAAAVIESQRATLGHERLLARFLGRRGAVSEDLVELELADPGGNPLVALQLADQAKSRSLAELAAGLVERRSAPNGGAGGADSAAADRVWSDLHATYRELFVAGTADPQRLAVLRDRAVQLEADARRLSPPVTPSVVGPGATPTWSLPDAPVVHYLVLGAEVLALVAVQGKVEILRDLCGLDEVAALAAKLSRQWDRVRVDGANRPRAQRLEAGCTAVLGHLYDALFEPVDALLSDLATRRDAPEPLVIVPHKLLHGVPFAALWDGTGYLADRYRLSLCPSLAVLHGCETRRLDTRGGPAFVAGVGDELAPLAGEEAAAVAALRTAAATAEVTLVRDGEATSERFLAGCRGASVIHLACHGWFRADNPMFSGLRLADRFVLAAEVLENAELEGATVVLSACDTGRAEVGGGDELLGLVRSFLGAGAASLVASLWPADDAAATALMIDFHAHLDEVGPSEALRRAQQTLRSRWPHPYYWAPFTVIGAA